jgi:hypothetical protein
MSGPRSRAEWAKYEAAPPEAIVRPPTSKPVLSSEQTASVRERAEAAASRNTPEGEVAPRDHETIAGVGLHQAGIGRVRDRVTIAENKKRDIPKPTPRDANADAWMESNERYKAKYGCYPPN